MHDVLFGADTLIQTLWMSTWQRLATSCSQPVALVVARRHPTVTELARQMRPRRYMADIANYTDAQPVVQISEVKM